MFWLWAGFIVLILGLLALDLGVLNRKSHVPSMKEAVGWTTLWISLGLAFTGVVYFLYEGHLGGAGAIAPGHDSLINGSEAALLYITGYLLEKSLSVDNVFVIAVIFNSFGVRPEHRHRVLFWGIMGALITRGAMIFGGVYLVTRFSWMFYVFGAYLVYVGLKLVKGSEAEKDPNKSLFVRTARKILPISDDITTGHFTTRVDGKRIFTPLLLTLVAIEATDVVFALDSIPAVLAITTDQFIVFTSNVFAILGLRSLFFVLADMMDRFAYLKYSLAAILSFIGAKMLLHSVFKVPNAASLLFIALALVAGIVGSLAATRNKAG